MRFAPIAGLVAVGVGSAIWLQGPAAVTRLLIELVECLEQYGYESIEEIRGITHRR